MRWRFLPTHRALVGWGGMADSAREASHLVMRCRTNATHPTGTERQPKYLRFAIGYLLLMGSAHCPQIADRK